MEHVDLNDLFSKDTNTKYSCAKRVMSLAKTNPAIVYPDLNFFVELLNSENRILRWTAIDVIGCLARVDDSKTVDSIKDKLFEMLDTGNMITANHAIAALSDIAQAKLKYQSEITGEILKVEKYQYSTSECRNIAIGKAIEAIGRYYDTLDQKKPVIDFVKRQTNNTRNATRKKAEQFLRKHTS